jgi:hypothetical protein
MDQVFLAIINDNSAARNKYEILRNTNCRPACKLYVVALYGATRACLNVKFKNIMMKECLTSLCLRMSIVHAGRTDGRNLGKVPERLKRDQSVALKYQKHIRLHPCFKEFFHTKVAG